MKVIRTSLWHIVGAPIFKVDEQYACVEVGVFHGILQNVIPVSFLASCVFYGRGTDVVESHVVERADVSQHDNVTI